MTANQGMPPRPALPAGQEWPDAPFTSGDMDAHALAYGRQVAEMCAALCENVSTKCTECAAHNDHDHCDYPGPPEFAAAIRQHFELEKP